MKKMMMMRTNSHVQCGNFLFFFSKLVNNLHSDLTAEEIAVKGAKEMEECYNILLTNIAKYITINVNLKTYEDVLVTLENGEVC